MVERHYGCCAKCVLRGYVSLIQKDLGKEHSMEKKGASEQLVDSAEGIDRRQGSAGDFTRRQVVIGGVGVGLAGLIAGGALAKSGCRRRQHRIGPHRARSHATETYRDRSRPLFGLPALRAHVLASQRRSRVPEHRPRARGRTITSGRAAKSQTASATASSLSSIASSARMHGARRTAPCMPFAPDPENRRPRGRSRGVHRLRYVP